MHTAVLENDSIKHITETDVESFRPGFKSESIASLSGALLNIYAMEYNLSLRNFILSVTSAFLDSITLNNISFNCGLVLRYLNTSTDALDE